VSDTDEMRDVVDRVELFIFDAIRFGPADRDACSRVSGTYCGVIQADVTKGVARIPSA
jgi:hypothetical protein